METFENSLTDYQRSQIPDLIDQAREILSKEFPQIENRDFYLSKENMIRFFIANNITANATIAKWKQWVTWRLSFQPENILENEEVIQKLDKTGVLRWYKHDKENRPCLYFKVNQIKPDFAKVDEYIRYIIYMVEAGLKQAQIYGTNQLTVIYDRRNFGKKNQDPSFLESLKKVCQLLQDYYPERLYGLYYLGSKLFAQVISEKSKSFISEKTRSKFQVLDDPQDLLQFFDKEDLSLEYGGLSDGKKFGQQPDRLVIGQIEGDDAISSEDEEDEYEQLEQILFENNSVNGKLQTITEHA